MAYCETTVFYLARTTALTYIKIHPKCRRKFQQHESDERANLHLQVYIIFGTPKYAGNWNDIIEKAQHDANIYMKYNLDSILIENMHDVPYVQSKSLGPETVACMTHLATAIRAQLPSHISCGIQVLACGNLEALAIAKACKLQFIRVEGYVFGHVADEGYTNACAGELLRYRRYIDAEDVLIFTDLKKKHSSHAITKDVSLLETAKAAEFFLTDGIVITGNSTGHAASPQDLADLVGNVNCPLLIGSGVTRNNVDDYFAKANAAIIGSHFKVNGKWENDLCEQTIEEFMKKVIELRKSSK